MSTLLAQLPYFLLTLAAFGTAGIFVIAVRKGIRGRAWLLMTVSFTALGVACFALRSRWAVLGWAFVVVAATLGQVGALLDLPQFVIGSTTNTFDATTTIWQFLSTHRLNTG